MRKYAIKKIYSTIFALEDITDGEIKTDIFGSVTGGFNDAIPYLFINPTTVQQKVKGAHYVYTLTPVQTDAIGDVHELVKFLGNSTDDSLNPKGFSASSVTDLRAKVLSFFPENPFIRQRLYAEEGYTLKDYVDFSSQTGKSLSLIQKNDDTIAGILFADIGGEDGE